MRNHWLSIHFIIFKSIWKQNFVWKLVKSPCDSSDRATWHAEKLEGLRESLSWNSVLFSFFFVKRKHQHSHDTQQSIKGTHEASSKNGIFTPALDSATGCFFRIIHKQTVFSSINTNYSKECLPTRRQAAESKRHFVESSKMLRQRSQRSEFHLSSVVWLDKLWNIVQILNQTPMLSAKRLWTIELESC